MEIFSKTTKNGEKLSSFVEPYKNDKLPIQSAMVTPLVNAIGNGFLLVSGETEKVTDFNDKSKSSTRAVYEVRVLSKKARVGMGTLLKIKIKDSQSIVSSQDNEQIMFGTIVPPVVVFDDLNLWVMNGNEGLTASGIRVLKTTPKEISEL